MPSDKRKEPPEITPEVWPMRTEAVKSVGRAVIPREVRNWMRSSRKSAGWSWHSARFKFVYS
jgi:hypothetical protein